VAYQTSRVRSVGLQQRLPDEASCLPSQPQALATAVFEALLRLGALREPTTYRDITGRAAA
jgi:hypothetical protein